MKKMIGVVLDNTVKATFLVLLLTAPALCDNLQPKEAASEETAERDNQKWHSNWTIYIYGSPEIAGVPKVILREHWLFGGRTLVAIWDDGTIAWLDTSGLSTSRKSPFMYFVSTIPLREIDEALGDIKKFTAGAYPERPQVAGTRSGPMNDDCVSLEVLDSELFITHLWSNEVLQSLEHVKKLLSAPTQGELVEYFQARLARRMGDKPWHFLGHRYAEYTEMKSEEIVGLTSDNPRASEVLKTIAERLVKDGNHFALCKKRIRSLIPKPEPGTTLISRALDFDLRRLEGTVEGVEGADSYVFSYRRVPEERKRDNFDD